ncbi:MAG: hypothetical protein M5R40_06250 [Anaerolineae bacterium]|nr:hypothetical protein [Anaerolineae bacterium]
MKVGLLWFDDDKRRTLPEKVARAAAYYEEKYEVTPTVCYVHPSALEGISVQANGVDVRPAPTVLPNHFWIGVDDQKAQSPKGRKSKSRRVA